MNNVLQFVKNLGTVKLALIGSGVLVFFILCAVYLYSFTNKDMTILYSDLDIGDSNKIIQELDSKKIPYEILSEGTAIKVPQEQVAKLRIMMAQNGLPNKGSIVGYEIFDKEETLGTTSFIQNIKMLRALEGEISRTINAFDKIEKARVHLVMPQKELFSKEKQEPRASVILKIRNNKSLTKAEIDAMSHLVATAVPALDVKNITIVDTKGVSLKLGARNEEDFSYYVSQNEEHRVTYENRLKKVIEDLLEKSLGFNKAKAQISVEMDFDKVITNSETYDPDKYAIRSKQTTEEREKSPNNSEDNLDVSVANNVPTGQSGLESSQNSNAATSEKTDETTNYEISKVVQNYIKAPGEIKKISIAVLVDGTYKPLDNKQMEYIPRTKEELAKIENLVKLAVGFREDRNDKIEVINMQFSQDIPVISEESTAWLKEEAHGILNTIIFGAITVLLFIFVIKPIAIQVFNVKDGMKQPNGDFLEPMLAEGLSAEDKNLSSIEQELDFAKMDKKLQGSMVHTRKVNEVIQSYPQESLSILRKWLST